MFKLRFHSLYNCFIAKFDAILCGIVFSNLALALQDLNAPYTPTHNTVCVLNIQLSHLKSSNQCHRIEK